MSIDAKQLWRQLSADKRKLGLICTLAFGALLLWGRLLMKDVPRTAVAVPGEQLAAAALMPDATDGSTTMAWPTVYVDLTNEVSRDLFRPDPRYYTLEDEQNDASAGLGKSGADPDDEQHGPAARLEAVQADAQELSLQSTILGNVSQALINGQLVSPGQSINGFEVLRVGSRRVTLVKDGIEIELEM